MQSKPQPYRPDLTPHPSQLRPHCAARDRLRLWQPMGRQSDSSQNPQPIELSEADLDRILEVMNVSWANGTREVYGSGLLVYHVFCDLRSIPEHQRAPASPLLIVAFISSCAGSYSGSTLANYVFGVRAWHTLHGQRWAMDDMQVKAALTGAANLAPPSSKRPKRAPFTVSLIEQILNKLNHSDPLDAAVAACLTTTFYTVARTGEFTVPSLNKFNPIVHIKRSDIRIGEDRHGMRVKVFVIPHTKCSPNGEDVYWAPQQGPSDPDAALRNHFEINNPPSDSHLFAYKHHKGMRPLTKRAFIDRLNAVAEPPNSQDLKGHGIRVGGTLEYLLRGIPFDVVKSIGRWSSEAFLLYLRQHAVIMAPYMQGHPVLDSFTRYTMPPVRHH
jgi:hypothetical protein